LLELVGDEAERLDRLVANLLRMSRIEAGALRLEREPVDIGHLVESCLNRLARLTRHVAIVAQVEGPLPLVAVDAVQLEQVVTNLVENAVKHSPVGASVFVRVVPDTDVQVRVSVADEGPGLGSRSTHELFERFAVVSDSGSSGVGLAIGKAIVEGHGGAIAGGNRAGGGACFTFVLPPSRLDVLVIDDEPNRVRILEVLLTNYGYAVRSAGSGEAALAEVAIREADLMLLDLGLPDIDGATVCRRLRQWTRNPIIVLTADDSDHRKVAALDEGADDYVTKPFPMPELLARLRVAGRQRRLLATVADDQVVRRGALWFDTGAHQAGVGDEPLALSDD
jgi:CheY-like chemotaxis protein/two-component sensor histidine kinase